MEEISFQLSKKGRTPKYQLLANSIIEKIEAGELSLDEKLPSVNKISRDLQFSRETVFKALNFLSEKGIVRSVDKIGYFVNDTEVETDYKVFFMLDKFTSFKEDLFNAVISKLNNKAKVDLFFHHHNFDLFASLIQQNLKNYTHFIVATYLNQVDEVGKVLKEIPPNKLILVDKKEPLLDGSCGMVYQNFEQDIYNTLSENIERVRKYDRIVFINHHTAPHGDGVKRGLLKFHEEYQIDLLETEKVSAADFRRNNLYITIDAYDRDLVQVILMIRDHNFTLGEDVGIISYNDTPVKEILEGGITVISTDFKKMGAYAAEMVLSGDMTQIPNPTHALLRKSF